MIFLSKITKKSVKKGNIFNSEYYYFKVNIDQYFKQIFKCFSFINTKKSNLNRPEYD